MWGIRRIVIDLESGRVVITFRLLEAISKIEKWFKVKPPARRAYAPEGTAKDSNRRNNFYLF